MKSDLDYIGAMFALVVGMINGIFAMFTSSVFFGGIGLLFAAIGWLLILR